MKKSEFRTPLIQSASVLGGVLIIFSIVASSGANDSGSGVLDVIFGIGHLILFVIGMGIALLFSIAILIAIFLAAVAMVNPGQASQMYSDLKKNFALNALSLHNGCCGEAAQGLGVSQEEYDRMTEEIARLQETKMTLQRNIENITGDNAALQTNVDKLKGENSTLREKIEELGTAVENLQNSESEIRDFVAKLTEKIQTGPDQELIKQISKLEQLHSDTQDEIENLMDRLKTLESGLKQVPTSGIFTYIEKEEDQQLFIAKVEEALAQDMTYAQIDDHLAKNLPDHLDKIIKDHPALTKNYIRDQRRD